MVPNIVFPIVVFAVGLLTVVPLARQKQRRQPPRSTTQLVDWRFSDLGPIVGESVHIRPLGEGDLNDYVDSIDSQVVANNGWQADSLRSIQRWKQDSEEAAALLTGNVAAIAVAGTEQVIGEVTAQTMQRLHDDDPRTVEVGIHLRADFRGRGVGTKALQAAIERLRQIGWSRIVIGCHESNRPMIAVAVAVGCDEYHRGPFEMANGRVTDAVWFELCPPRTGS